ncbi:MAG: DUF2934 domain-containing protein [FCB group bacterium]|nr:DUF2934 domain-containing protein [FCB group bacterium]
MANEIKRNYWSRFCRKFNTANQYRRTVVNITAGEGVTETIPLSPFMGVTLSRKGKYIDGIQILAGQPNPETVANPILTIKQPEKVIVESDREGIDRCLRISSKDGTETMLELDGERESNLANSLVEKLAYSMFERRGQAPGNDKDDWFEAERKVRDAELELTSR